MFSLNYKLLHFLTAFFSIFFFLCLGGDVRAQTPTTPTGLSADCSYYNNKYSLTIRWNRIDNNTHKFALRLQDNFNTLPFKCDTPGNVCVENIATGSSSYTFVDVNPYSIYSY